MTSNLCVFLSEWMEFSPYEIGMPKYGTFMKPELFGSKFFMGHLVKEFEEPPLHFLQGILVLFSFLFIILQKNFIDQLTYLLMNLYAFCVSGFQ